MSEFEKYRLRQQRLRLLEELHNMLKNFFNAVSINDLVVVTETHYQLKKIMEEIDKLPPPQGS